MKQKHTFYRRKSTNKNSLRSAHLTTIILLEYCNQSTTTTTVQAHSFSRCAKVAPFCVGDLSLYLHVDDAGGFAQCCTRCGSRQEAARATVTPVPSAQTADRRHAPGRESAPRRPTGTEQGQERGVGTRCTTRPSSGTSHPPRWQAPSTLPWVDVPKISLEDIPARRLCREPQLVADGRILFFVVAANCGAAR